MAKKGTLLLEQGRYQVTVRWAAITQEWVVRVYDLKGSKDPLGVYYTEDVGDAHGTAEAMLAEALQKGASK